MHNRPFREGFARQEEDDLKVKSNSRRFQNRFEMFRMRFFKGASSDVLSSRHKASKRGKEYKAFHFSKTFFVAKKGLVFYKHRNKEGNF
ncbi:hypothetical protein CEXT_336941 [Caerostris extrusa]|uniref:Uncharacterized protein n=1 Tax=Caerostris extrusa TaxID=172846 RepID=A0AAV4SXG5_CAEEX|nr:hypothetical protein CEXT_336941 [Caerostris extrusa]